MAGLLLRHFPTAAILQTPAIAVVVIVVVFPALVVIIMLLDSMFHFTVFFFFFPFVLECGVSDLSI